MGKALPAGPGLLRFLVVSLGLHLAVLLGSSADSARLAPVPRAPLQGVLITSGADVRKSSAPTTRAVPRVLPRPKPAVVSTEKNATPVLAEHEAPPMSKSEAISPVAMSGNAGTAEPAAKVSPQEGVSSDAVRQYLFLLVPEARRLKRYPALARERGWEGMAEITVKLDGVQSVPAVVVTRSSGFPVLDEQALTTIGQAARMVAVPEFLRGKSVAIPVPVRFSLSD